MEYVKKLKNVVFNALAFILQASRDSEIKTIEFTL